MTSDTPLCAAVTGASRGIGRETALALARKGYRVFALARSEADLERLATEAATAGLAVEPVVMDVADDDSRARAIAAIMTATNGYGLDILVNNAGYGHLGPVEEVSVADLRRQFEVNVVGLHAFTVPFLPGMRHRDRGWVVNVSSAAGRVATPFMGAYSASKFAVEALSDSLRVELMPFGVRVILIEPGPIETNFSDAAVQARDEYSPYAPFRRRWDATRGSSNLFQRSARTVARVIVRAIHSRHPRPRYTVTISAKAGTAARRAVPDLLTDWALSRAIGRRR